MNPLLLLFITASLIAYGVFLLRMARRLLATGLKAEATVIRNEFRTTTSTDFYQPVVEFKTNKQETIVQKLGRGYKPAKAVGTKLQIIYEADHPTNVQVDSFFQLRVLPWLAIIVGSGGLILTLLNWTGVVHIGR
ncbi:MAG: DUF3592 domain-containing protein [Lacunisphaera sp.]